jgi:hypothetical protein
MEKKDFWVETTKTITFETHENGNLNNNIEKATWILLTKLKKESQLLNANQKFNSKNRNIRDLYRGVNEFKKGYHPRTNMIKEENGDLLADSHSILNTWKN